MGWVKTGITYEWVEGWDEDYIPRDIVYDMMEDALTEEEKRDECEECGGLYDCYNDSLDAYEELDGELLDAYDIIEYLLGDIDRLVEDKNFWFERAVSLSSKTSVFFDKAIDERDKLQSLLDVERIEYDELMKAYDARGSRLLNVRKALDTL
jgi:hypothetical protein